MGFKNLQTSRRLDTTLRITSVILIIAINLHLLGCSSTRLEDLQLELNLAEARRLAAESVSTRALQSHAQERVHLLAIASMNIMETSEGIRALRSAGKHGIPYKLFQYEHGLSPVSFSPDGQLMLSVGADSTARITRILDNTEVTRIKYDYRIRFASLSADGRYLLTRKDKTARVTRISDSREVARATHRGAVSGAYLSPDNQYMVSCDGHSSNTVTTRVTRISDNLEVARVMFGGQHDGVSTSSTDQYAVSTNSDNQTSLIVVSDDKEIVRLNCGKNERASPDGKYIATWYGNLLVKRLSDGELVARVRTGRIRRVAFSPNGKYIAGGSSNGHVIVARVSGSEFLDDGYSAGEYVASIDAHDSNSITSLSFSPDGKYIASGSRARGSREYAVIVTRISDKKEVARVMHENGVNAVSFSADGQYIITGGADNTVQITRLFNYAEDSSLRGRVLPFSSDGEYIFILGGDYNSGTVRVVRFSDKQEMARVTLDPWQFRNAASSPDRKYLVSGGWNHRSMWKELPDKTSVKRISEDSEVAQIKPKGGLHAVSFSPDGRYIATSAGDRVYVTRVSDFEEVAQIEHENLARELAFSSNSEYLATGSFDGDARVTRISDNEEVVRVTHGKAVHAVGLSPDGAYVLSGSADSTARITRFSDNEEMIRIRHAGEVKAARFSSDGAYVASASSNGIARVTQVSNDTEILRVRHDEEIFDVVFSPDGRYLASASDDGTARVTRIADNREVARAEHGRRVYSVFFSPDSRYLISQDSYGSIVVSDLDNSYLKDQLCKTLPGNFTALEWEQYFEDLSTYDRTCPNLPIHPSYFERVGTLIVNGQTERAETLLQRANQLDSSLRIDVKAYLDSLMVDYESR